MATDQELFALAQRVGRDLLEARLRLVTAESCTAGWIAKALTDIAGSSRWFECGYVTYSDAAKMRDLGVSAATIVAHGAVSEQTVREMATGAIRLSGADIGVAVSGIAGPDGGSPQKPVGTVWLCVARRSGEIFAAVERFPGGREDVRRLTVERALQMVADRMGSDISRERRST
ncbi:MAG TPA: nicotinamide-nucleotide amidohydrolase family protein [Steroidobacteraceae bacterium]|jgi:nicotinamide-nucleotide amidase